MISVWMVSSGHRDRLSVKYPPVVFLSESDLYGHLVIVKFPIWGKKNHMKWLSLVGQLSNKVVYMYKYTPVTGPIITKILFKYL